MAQTVDGVECEGSGEDSFSGILDTLGKAGNNLNNVCAVECTGGDKVGNRESVKHYFTGQNGV